VVPEDWMDKSVLFETRNGIAIITLNRPERRNAINQDLLVGLYNSLDAVSSSNEIKAAILTGSGKSFCSGIDLESIKTDNLFDPRGDGTDLPDAFADCGKPLIGAINGHAITGGFEIALNCDFLIASENASFADTHAKVGIHPGWGMTQLLQQAVGRRMAKQMSLTCSFLTAADALRIGLVNEVVPQADLMARALHIASDIATLDMKMVKTIRNLIDCSNDRSCSDALEYERKGFRDFIKRGMKL
jgi:enoyl-CoA hydratase